MKRIECRKQVKSDQLQSMKTIQKEWTGGIKRALGEGMSGKWVNERNQKVAHGTVRHGLIPIQHAMGGVVEVSFP